MSLYAIGDLHFSTLVEKPMNIFGDKWDKHEEKIISSWKDNVKDEDVVLVLGDTSWGINLTEAKPDLDIISNLCGNKIFIKGNHDYWWTTVTNLNKLYDNMKFLQTNFYEYGEYAICGGRGFVLMILNLMTMMRKYIREKKIELGYHFKLQRKRDILNL